MRDRGRGKGGEGSPYRVQEPRFASLTPGAPPLWEPSEEVGGTHAEVLRQRQGSWSMYLPVPVSPSLRVILGMRTLQQFLSPLWTKVTQDQKMSNLGFRGTLWGGCVISKASLGSGR